VQPSFVTRLVADAASRDRLPDPAPEVDLDEPVAEVHHTRERLRDFWVERLQRACDGPR
jgi:hypothetical protein